MNTKKTKNRARILIIRLFLNILCQVTQSVWWQDSVSPHIEGTTSEIIEWVVEHGSCVIRKIGHK